MKLFDWENRMSTDTCAINEKNKDNESIISYNVLNSKQYINEKNKESLLSQYPNLRYKNGYGNTTGCTVDQDSKVRLVSPTHGPERRQLFSRNFVSVPDFSRGSLNAIGTESLLKNGPEDTQQCKIDLREVSVDRYVPFTDSMKQFLFGCRQITAMPFGMDTREQYRCLSRSNK